MTVGTSQGVLGACLPSYGEYEQTQQNIATDMVTLTGKSGMTADFIVLRTSAGTEKVYFKSTGSMIFGASSSSAAAGIGLTSANPQAVAAYSDDAGAILTADVDGIRSRLLIFTDQTGAYAAQAIKGHLRVAAADLDPSGSKAWNGVAGYVEFSGTHTIGANAIVAAVSATIENATTTITSGGIQCGVHVVGRSLIAAPSGESIGVYFQAVVQGYEHAFGFSGVGSTDGNGLTTGSDSTNCTHKIAIWINGVGTRYLHVFSD